jgi:hypothetical protein
MKLAKINKALHQLPLVVLATVTLAATAYGQGNSGDKGMNSAPHGNGKNLVQNGTTAIKGNLRTSQHIYYVGDELEISLQFARGHDLLADGEADAHVVIYSFDGSVTATPVPADIGPSSRKFFSIPNVSISTLPEGQYQLGLIVTVPDGDPTLLEDWYGGFRALLDTEAVYISTKPLDTDDDGDGEHDDDEDGDGIDGEEDDEADDD